MNIQKFDKKCNNCRYWHKSLIRFDGCYCKRTGEAANYWDTCKGFEPNRKIIKKYERGEE